LAFANGPKATPWICCHALHPLQRKARRFVRHTAKKSDEIRRRVFLRHALPGWRIWRSPLDLFKAYSGTLMHFYQYFVDTAVERAARGGSAITPFARFPQHSAFSQFGLRIILSLRDRFARRSGFQSCLDGFVARRKGAQVCGHSPVIRHANAHASAARRDQRAGTANGAGEGGSGFGRSDLWF
jgi:hypothetical protein